MHCEMFMLDSDHLLSCTPMPPEALYKPRGRKRDFKPQQGTAVRRRSCIANGLAHRASNS